MSEIRLRQYELTDFNDNTRMVCWLESSKDLKEGTRLTLKGIPKRDWIITRVYKTERSVSELSFSRSWKVGGLL